MVKIWLDDARTAPLGWTRTQDIEEVKKLLRVGEVEELALDNDLGRYPPCATCNDNACPIVIDEQGDGCSCSCHAFYAEGYKLVDWMEEQNLWPKCRPTVHSNNRPAADRMRLVIRKHYDGL